MSITLSLSLSLSLSLCLFLCLCVSSPLLYSDIITIITDELSRNLSGHFENPPPSPTPHEPGHMSHPATNDGVVSQQQPVTQKQRQRQSHEQEQEQDGISSHYQADTVGYNQSHDHDRDLQLLLNESIRAATRTCLWVFRCQIAKTLARAFHLWCRHTSPSASATTGAVAGGGVISYEHYSAAINQEGVAIPLITGAPAATRALPPAAVHSLSDTVPDRDRDRDRHITDLSDHRGEGEVTGGPIPLLGQRESLIHSKSGNFSDLSDSDLTETVQDQAVQDLLNSSIVSAVDSLHDDKRSLLRE